MARRRTSTPTEPLFDLTGTSLETAQPVPVGVDVPIEAVERAASAPRSASTPTTSTGRNCLYFDLETCPDEVRGGPMGELFGLEPIPPIPALMPAENLLDPEQFLSQSLDEIKRSLRKNNYPDEWIEKVRVAEREGKNRKGFDGAIEERNAARNAVEARRKLLSVTPEYCRIVAMGWAVGGAEPTALVCNEETGERRIIAQFWDLAARHSPVVGFNINHFDLRVILVRSIILGVTPTRCFADLKPWDQSKVVDVFLCRHPRGFVKEKEDEEKASNRKLKDLARLYGIDVPAGDADGSEVYEMVRTNPEALRRYVTSDVVVTRELHRMWVGTFCVQ